MQYPMYSQTYNYNSMGLTNNEQKIKDEIKSQTALLDVFLSQKKNNVLFLDEIEQEDLPTNVDVDDDEKEKQQTKLLKKDDHEYDINEFEDDLEDTRNQLRDIVGSTPVKKEQQGKNGEPAPAPNEQEDDNEDIAPMTEWALSTMKLAQ